MSGICVGVDPDLHASGIAWVDLETGKLLRVGICRTAKDLKEREACAEASEEITSWCIDHLPGNIVAAAIEGQEVVYSAQHGAGPRPLLFLAHITGMWASAVRWMRVLPVVHLYIPAPQEWKGSVPKHVKQARIAASVGIETLQARPSDPYCYPKEPHTIPGGDGIKKSEWSEIIDAIGLALFAREKYLKERKKNAKP